MVRVAIMEVATNIPGGSGVPASRRTNQSARRNVAMRVSRTTPQPMPADA